MTDYRHVLEDEPDVPSFYQVYKLKEFQKYIIQDLGAEHFKQSEYPIVNTLIYFKVLMLCGIFPQAINELIESDEFYI